MVKRVLTLTLLASISLACVQAPAPCGPVPTGAQLEWQKMEMNLFVHFGPNTFSGREWGLGTEAEDLFNPSALDCRQWADIARRAGMKGIILTAKHHDGFCLWPSPESSHTVRESRWRNGNGDVLKELSEACAAAGLKMGVYISPWDRNDPAYGTPEYNEKYARTLRSVHDGRYGVLFEQWFDGACGEGPDGRVQEYDWPLFHRSVLSLKALRGRPTGAPWMPMAIPQVREHPRREALEKEMRTGGTGYPPRPMSPSGRAGSGEKARTTGSGVWTN